MPTTTSNLALYKPTVGGDTDAWGGYLNSNADVLDGLFDAGPILKSSKGGTGNAFFAVSGPASSTKTYTFPNENMTIGYRAIPQSGSAKTTSYSLATTDIGKYIEISTGGSITVPDATFAAGDVVVLINNTASAITVTCSITTAYLAGTDGDKATVSLAARGTANVFFLSGTACIISGNVT